MNNLKRCIRLNKCDLDAIDQAFMRTLTPEDDDCNRNIGLDPKKDPFGRDFNWLLFKRPQFDIAHEYFLPATNSELIVGAGTQVAALVRGIANDKELTYQDYETWALKEFERLSSSQGMRGKSLFEMMRFMPIDPTRETIKCIDNMMCSSAEIQLLTDMQKMAVAMIVYHALSRRHRSMPTR
jgi:hypothetical protein